jgi:dinuclear metal center YbgI/SA1388 family protein
MVALDATPAVIESALHSNCQLLVTHHPLIFKPRKTISTTTAQGRMIFAAIRGGLGIISMHTNYDIAGGGLNDLLAEKLALPDCTPLQVTSTQELVKLVVFVPHEHLERLRIALFPHAESLGAYRDCSFAASGEGTFTPQEGAIPFTGTVGSRELAREYRLELLVDRTRIAPAIKALIAAHPYEEPAFDVYPLHNEGKTLGLGRIGRLPEATTLAEFAALTAARLVAPGTRFVGDPSAVVQKVAICSGSGASLMRYAARAGADVLVTGDIKYHDARDAEDLGIALIDAGHFRTEIIMADAVRELLLQRLSDAGFVDCRVMTCGVENDPFSYL